MDDPKSERDYELVLGCAKGIRSLLQEYSVKEDGKAWVQSLSEEAYRTASTESASVKTLAGKPLAHLDVLQPGWSVPAACAVYPVSAEAAVFLEIQGRVDPEAEMEKTKPKVAKAAEAVREQEKLLGNLGDKVGEEIRAKEGLYLKNLRSEQRAYEESLKRFEEMRIR